MSYNHEYPYVDPYRSNADWLLHKVKSFEETLNDWVDTINELKEALTEINSFDERITALENATADLDSLRARIVKLEGDIVDLYNYIGTVNSGLSERIDAITVNYNLVLSEIERLADLFPTYLKLAEDYTDNKIYELTLDYRATVFRLEAEIEELRQLRPISIINPVRGRATNLQEAINLAYADMRDDAVTSNQFDELGLTASQFAAIGLNAIEFALHSFTIFKLDYVTGAVTGIKKKVSHAISEVVEFVLGSFTATEFAALDITASEFEALDYTCLSYLMANDASRGLTANEFSDIIKSGGSNILRLD